MITFSTRRGCTSVPVQSGRVSGDDGGSPGERRPGHHSDRLGRSKKIMIETFGYARAGMLGNPSDGYFGKTLVFRDVELARPCPGLSQRPPGDQAVQGGPSRLRKPRRSVSDYALAGLLRRHPHHPGTDRAFDRVLPRAGDRTPGPQFHTGIRVRRFRSGSGWAGRAPSSPRRCGRFVSITDVEIPLPIQANLVLETETRELNVPAGLQDRVIQAYHGLVYMDFSRDLMEARGYGEYERLDPGLLPNIYVAARTSLSEGTEVFHSNLRERWRRGDPEVVGRHAHLGGLCRRGQSDCLLRRDYARLGELINANFDLRAQNLSDRPRKSGDGRIPRGRPARPPTSPDRAAPSSALTRTKPCSNGSPSICVRSA